MPFNGLCGRTALPGRRPRWLYRCSSTRKASTYVPRLAHPTASSSGRVPAQGSPGTTAPSRVRFLTALYSFAATVPSQAAEQKRAKPSTACSPSEGLAAHTAPEDEDFNSQQLVRLNLSPSSHKPASAPFSSLLQHAP